MATSQFKTILLFSIFLLVTHHNSFASKNLVEVEGEYTYYIPYNVSRDKAEQTAMQRAMVAALAKEFGTLVSEISHLDMKSSKDSENVDFWSSASTLVKGEWIETIGRPIFTPSIENGDFVMTCKIRGKLAKLKCRGRNLTFICSQIPPIPIPKLPVSWTETKYSYSLPPLPMVILQFILKGRMAT